MEGAELSSGNKPDRKTIEKNRRILMKDLCFKLVSLIPDHHFTLPKEFLSQQDQLEQAASYIKILSERIEELKRRKAQMMNTDATNNGTNIAAEMGEPKLPILKIKELGSDVEVVLISGLHKNFMLHQIVSILEEGGAQVLTVSVSTIGDKIFRTLHAQVKVPRVGVDTSKISDRIQELIA